MTNQPKRKSKKELDSLREWGKMLFIHEKLTQKEVSEKTGVSAVTVNKWAQEGDWEGKRKTFSVTREERYRSTIDQLTQLDKTIDSREDGAKFPSKDESNIRRKLVADMKSLETECNIVDVINVSIKITEWLRPVDPEKAKDVADIFNLYIIDHQR